MITLNQTIGGNLLVELNKGKSAKEDLKEIIDRATNKDAILIDLLDASGYSGNNWFEATGVLTEAPIIAYGAIYDEDEEIDMPIDYEKARYFSNYQTESFANTLLRDGKVVFTKA
jgi:uncharacterized Ntn-hydrolase superfamily protein